MTILIDTKNEMKRSIDGLDSRLSEVDRELRAAFARETAALRESSLADLKSSQQETRTSAYNAGKRASEAVTAVTDLRRDIDYLRAGLEDLKHSVGEVLSLLREAVPVTLGTAHRTEAGAGEGLVDPLETGLGPDGIASQPLLPGQRKAPSEETEPAAEDATAAGGGPADASAETTQEAGLPGSLTDGQQPEPEAAGQAVTEEGREEEGEQDAPRALLQADDRNVAPVEEPYPLSSKGRIWAIMRAGSVASATLVCQRDTWEFVAAEVGNHPHFRTPTLEERTEGLVAAVLSGRSLVAMLLALYKVAEENAGVTGANERVAKANWAMASEVYIETARALSRAHAKDGDPVVVTIDRRVPAGS
ncbi:hypothetical protein ACGFZB_41225 [Streptomyces cinerochromogenes]|uniref:Uncharacterized protein n=1 Tax=Streptomyces cinerochromogenes TaxID=66422 RepID=A0ABW7BHW1_9ACTN